MMIYAKLGTGPAGYYNVLRKKNIKKGDFLEIRPFTAGTYHPWQRVHVSEIREVSGQPFYVLELM